MSVSSISKQKLKINWEGAFLARHSLAIVNRELASALLDAEDLDIRIRDVEPAALSSDASSEIKRLISRFGSPHTEPDVTIRHFWPPNFSRPIAGKLILIQPWEFGAFPVEWVSAIGSTVDQLWVPSNYVRECAISSGIPPNKVTVVPNGIRTEQFRPAVKPLPLPTTKSFKFLFIGGTIPRKGIDLLLKAYQQTFTVKDDVSLVIKDFGINSFYRGQTATSQIHQAIAEPNAPEIIYLTEDMPEDALPGLYTACNCLVHPYRGEGFGLPIAEAMASGLPVIVPDKGAARDFTGERNAILVASQKVYFNEKRIGQFVTSGKPYWFETDMDALAGRMRSIYENPTAYQEIAKRGREDILAGFTWRIAAEKALASLRAISEKAASASEKQQTWEKRKEEAIRLTRSGEWERALAEIRALLAERSRDNDLLNAYGVALYRTGQRKQAFDLFDRNAALSAFPRDFLHNLAFLQCEAGEWDSALENAIKAYQITPDKVEIGDTLRRALRGVISAVRRERRGYKNKGRKSNPSQKATARIEQIQKAQRLLDTSRPSDQPDASDLKGANRGEPRVSLCMIVKNEEEFLAGCLESVSGAVDEIVIVDTGSTDGTISIGERYGAKIHHFEWIDDFAAARNASLLHATGDWVLWLDADERLMGESAKMVRELVSKASPHLGGYICRIRNRLTSTEADKSGEYFWHSACRLFRRHPAIRFEQRIHEQNMRTLVAAGFDWVKCEAAIDHLGYTAEMMTDRNKRDRFIQMLTREIEEGVDPAFRGFQQFNLGNTYFVAGDFELAITCFEQAADSISLEDEYPALLFSEWASSLLILNRPAEALEVCERADKVGIRHPAIWFERGHAYLAMEDSLQAEIAFRAAIDMGNEPDAHFAGDEGSWLHKARYALAMVALNRADYEAAAAYASEALALRDNFGDAQEVRARALNALGRKEEAIEDLLHLIKAEPNRFTARRRLGLILADLARYAEALPHLQVVSEQNTDDIEVLSKLAESAENVGQFDTAVSALQKLCSAMPRSADHRVRLGRSYAKQGDTEKALTAYAVAAELEKDSANTCFNLADALYQIGQYHLAIEALQKALKLEPNRAEGYFVLGNCYYRLGAAEAAIASYQVALSFRADYQEAQHNMKLAAAGIARSEAA